ncbi:hypothetical protein PF005_g22218 [Phytophthora fragariae]|uniref:Uncharacterized protein n=1 Tax=Phytophthora fragariae TaxID=53985 RepID=A0A6A3WD33_9STRA|nr:hypothetical protein PF003_g6005 [Phytophthora fragariae]KAE8926782.1 hypothetical protein PF009_g23034 [Phytophthora fragariae]KAE8960814.1 hypothetical protein PF011_g29969 [Phytophthora fragariae]KAE9082669.1 hypothetical protein PF007_g22205 [Phytophthora fragariae]KAE9082783.1 hypothetical protein PF010_g21447 [Phytophthora fragariae]
MPRWEWEAKVPAKWTALKALDLEEEPKESQVPAGVKTETSIPTWNLSSDTTGRISKTS